MILNTGSIKFYDGFVYHKRNGAKEHFFKNNINAIFIELINNNGDKIKTETNGTGPVDAVCNAIDKIISFSSKLTEFSVNSVTEGIDALGEVTIRVENKKGRTFTGIGSDSDIVVASAKAYLNAINRQVQMMNEGSESPGSGAGR